MGYIRLSRFVSAGHLSLGACRQWRRLDPLVENRSSLLCCCHCPSGYTKSIHACRFQGFSSTISFKKFGHDLVTQDLVHEPSPEQTASWASFLLYIFLDPLVIKASRTPHLPASELPVLPDYDHASYLVKNSFKVIILKMIVTRCSQVGSISTPYLQTQSKVFPGGF